MNEPQVNGAQADDAPLREADEDEAQGVGDGVDEGTGVDEELLRQTHLSAMLTELVRRQGPTKVARMLGVNYKTVSRALKSGKVTDHMREALERLMEPVDGPQAAGQHGRIGALGESVKRLEGGMDALAKELRSGLDEMRTAVAGQSEAPGGEEARDRGEEGVPRAEDGNGGDGAGRSETSAAPPVARQRPLNPDTLQPFDPEIVTVEPADDVEVYADAWPLVEEWRKLRVGHPNRGRTLSWLENEERLLTLELAMLEEHGLTLPPETQPLRGFGRKGQTTHRWKALADTRVALRKRELLRWVRRVCTLGLWWK